MEELLGVYWPAQYHIEPPSDPLPAPGAIRLINRKIYRTIKQEIGGAPDSNRSLESLLVIQYIQQNWKDRVYLPHFMYFARML